MAFPIPSGLQVVSSGILTSEQLTVLEQSTAPGFRLLVGLQLSGGIYDGLAADITAMEAQLQAVDGLNTWPEYSQFLTLDLEGEEIVWLAYVEGDPVYAPQGWWLIIGVIMLLPILGLLPVFLVDLIAPGLMEGIMSMFMLIMMMVIMVPMMKGMTAPAQEEKAITRKAE